MGKKSDDHFQFDYQPVNIPVELLLEEVSS